LNIDAITNAHFQRLTRELGGLYAVQVNVGGAWRESTLGKYHSPRDGAVAPVSLMLQLCQLTDDWLWLDAINLIAEREYVARDPRQGGRDDE